MIIFGIETSCDETSAAVVEDGRRLLSNVVASQMEEHARFGGVVPELASRRHVEALLPVFRQALSEAGVTWAEIDAIAVTNRPGLLGALLVGTSAAKALGMALKKPVVPVHHIEAHLYANWLVAPPAPMDGGERGGADYPAVALVVSGGHTDLFHLRGHGDYVLLGRTRDDAAGEAFDKCARLMGLGYPGGPAMQRAAEGGNPKAIAFPRALLPGTHEFSFSGLKTSVRYAMQGENLPSLSDIAASFQEAVVDVLSKKTVAAAKELGVEHVLLAGGVSANTRLREVMQERCDKAGLALFYPPVALCTDNAAMIACAGYWYLQNGRTSSLDFETRASEPLAALSGQP
ncbi:tRNA (adenosine(37)-N6)-threonylcarbamoyltransferase complex transferase subunit TsaD [Armatimonas rosea]|uniref:tRNA N6-adenosine threonylcarbamoyltransferase n=1 Tax=Armatimonas rosea TaxID=685828 RepID=A0A7W9W622_ARMRO|nr:N6-L-threonylcarbamoyladenine synthase [Armatimonas rosea]